MSRLRCHSLDRQDELEMITRNRQLLGGPAAERAKLEEVIRKAEAALVEFDRSEAATDRWLRLLKDSLIHRWIDNPDAYMKEWYEKNP